jgi:hypothetical protein
MNYLFLRSLLAGSLLILSVSLQAQVVITEFMANNNRILADQDGDYSDWIELHNSGNTSVNLAGWYLTDSLGQLTKWRLPDTTLVPNAFLVVFASGKNRAAAGAQLHANFSLDADGEYLALVMPDGTGVASEFRPVFPEQTADISYGTFQGADYYFSKPTPGAANAAGFIAIVAEPKFSQDRGFYETPFDLTIASETPGVVIRYTTNGTPPAATNGVVYTAPLAVSSTSTIRAAAFKSGYLTSKIVTHTFLFLEDVIRQSPTGAPPPGWPATWGANTRDYGMDPDVVNNPLYSGTIKDDLKTIPSFSIVMDLKDLFDPARGIYANPGQDGRDWERPTSVELINPDGSKGFQVNAGIRIRGGFSRNTSNPKHALRLLFRDEYGDAKLKYPLFGDAGTDTFDNMDLRTFQNYSWSFQGDSRGVFIRDQFSRDTQLDMGRPSTRGNYYHLYINGQYWGLYNTQERSEASFGETYFGGQKEDYDVIKVEAGSYALNATDGNMTAWTLLYNLAKAGLDTAEAYQRIQGNNPDGTRNPAYQNLVDIPNLIDYMLVIIYGGNLDAPISNFLSNTSPNNWYGIRNRNGTEGFRFFAHDSEHTLLNVNEDRTGPFGAGDTSVLKSSPQYILKRLQANPEFRLLMADHIHRHFFNGGALTPAAARARFLVRKTEIDRAVVSESARWGDAKRAAPFTRADWITAGNTILNSFFPQRGNIVLNQLRADGFYPNVAPPAFNQHGGNIPRGFNLTMSATSGTTIYFTRDGTDPRLTGGDVASGAQPYNSPMALNESLHVKSRALSGGVWSALNEATFTVIQAFTELLITEIMYNPVSEAGVDGDELEFIELKNVAGSSLDLSGVHFTNGIVYAFPNGTILGPGQFAVLVSNAAEFQKKYPAVRVTGTYTGRLNNAGEGLALVHAAGAPIVSVSYGDQLPWPTTADGNGFSLVAVNPNFNPNANDPVNWRASSTLGGSPGADDPPSLVSVVRINEVLTHTDPPDIDAIELHNPTASAVNIGDWYLTDNRAVPKKFRIPAGTTISPGGYLVFTESDFNRNPGADTSFTLSSHGEEIYLYSADASGNLTGFSDGFSFGAAANGTSLGRHTLSTGEVDYPAQASKSLGAANSGPQIGPVVINEIFYQPSPGAVEFLELKNITGTPVKLYDSAYPTNTWRLDGLGFSFPQNTEIEGNGLLLIVGSDPALFRSRNNVPANVPVFGPFFGVLQDSGELLQLQRPDVPDVDANGLTFVPFITIDQVRYNDKAPWPTNAAGSGASLERANARAYGNDPINWRSSFGLSSPGYENSGNRSPRVNAGADFVIQSAAFPVLTNLVGTAIDDGSPNPPGALALSWSLVSGPTAALFANPNQSQTSVTFPKVGTYVLRLTASDGELAASDDVSVNIERVPLQSKLIAVGSVWKYLDNGSNQGTNWRAPGFNDSSWASGKAELGYGDGDEATVVSFGPSSGNKYPTTYFRHAFQANNTRLVTQLTLKLLRDDGAIVYLNGVEVFRSNMPEGNVDYLTWASSNTAGADGSTFYERLVDPSLLSEGNNVAALELHQFSASSGDISMDFELTALSTPPDDSMSVWKAQFFSPAELADSAVSGDDADPDQDGHTNLQEFVAGTNPRDGQSILALSVAERTAAGAKLRFSAVAGKTYTVQYRDSLLTGGAWFKLADLPAQSASALVEVNDANSGSSTVRYYRIVTPQQP